MLTAMVVGYGAWQAGTGNFGAAAPAWGSALVAIVMLAWPGQWPRGPWWPRR